MNLYHDDHLSIFFGDAGHEYVPQEYQGPCVLEKRPFKHLADSMDLKQLVFLKQVHGVQGKIVTMYDAEYDLPSFVHEGDFLITNVPGIGLGVSTADCLPVIFIDRRTKTVAVAHAGWRGTLQEIGVQTVQRMQQQYGTRLDDLTIFIGPGAKSCCYEVQADVLLHLSSTLPKDGLIFVKDGRYFIALDRLNLLQLKRMGIKQESFVMGYNQCTICNPAFCSVRRTPERLERQMTVVALR